MKKLLFSLCLGLFSLASLAQTPPNVQLPSDLRSDSTKSRPRKGDLRLFPNALGQIRVMDYLGNRNYLKDLLGPITGGSGISQSFADGRYLLNTYAPTWSSVTGKPAFFSGNYADLAGKPTIPTLPAWLPSSDPGYLTLTSGDGRYRLATVAIDYTALINKPTIPVVPAWVPTTDPGYLTSSYVPTWTSITGKPAFFSGNYNDLINKPTIPVVPAWVPTTDPGYLTSAYVPTWASITGKPSFFSGSYLDLTNRPTLSTVAGTGSYTDLINKPTIPAATVITNNVTTITTGTALDAVWGKTFNDAITANTNALTGKQASITTGSSLAAGSLTLANRPALGDSSTNAATTGWSRAEIERSLSKLKVNRDSIRALFSVTGTGLSYDPTTGKFTFTGGGGGSSNLITTTDAQNSSVQATYLLPPAAGARIFIGSSSLGATASFKFATSIEDMPGFRFRNGGLLLGTDADATITRFNNVISLNSSSSGTGLDNGFKFYGSPSRYMKINEDDGSKAPLLMRITTAGQVGIGVEAPTANLDVNGTAKVSGAAQVVGQLTVPSVKFAGDNSVMASAPATVCSSLAELAAATTRLAIYDGSHWVRVSGNVGTDPGANNFYFATQYNSGSDHYERQFMGRAKFEWWKPSSSNTWEQLKYATNSRLPIQIANGDYYFNQLVYITPGTQVYGHSTSPDSVRFHINGSTPQLFTSWYWFDGNVAGKKAENIVFDGFTLYQESSYVAKRDTNDFYGPIAIDGGGSFNNVIRNIKYKQVSTTAIVNAIVVKMGAQRPCDGLLIDNVQSLTSTVKGRMLVEVLNQGDRNAGQPERIQVPAKNVEIRNCVADGFRFGISIAGYFDKPYVHHNIVRNCTDYGVEFAGPLVGGRCEFNGFGGTQNVLIAGNYYADQTADWVFPAGTGQRYVGNFTEGKVTGGYVEIRSGGTIDFSDNNFQIDGGVLLQNTTFAGVRGGQFTRNRIISTMTNSNWRGQAKAIVFMNGATGLDVSNNYLERGGTDADALIQSNANGVSSVSNRFYNNVYQVGTNGTYYGNTSTSAVRFNNFDVTGTARN